MDEREIEKILEYWAKMQAFRPYYNDSGNRIDCSRTSEDKPVLPWETEHSPDLEYVLYLGNYDVLTITGAVYRNRDKNMQQDEAELLDGIRSNLCVLHLDAHGKLKKNSLRILPFMYLMGQLLKSLNVSGSIDFDTLIQKNGNFGEELGKIGSISFEEIEKLERNILTSLGFNLSDVKNKNNNLTTLFIEELPAETPHDKTAENRRKKLASAEESRKEKRGRKQEPWMDLIEAVLPENNYIIDSIASVSAEKMPRLLSQFMKTLDGDVEKTELGDFLRNLNPLSSPFGSWPGEIRTDILQQYAINTVNTKRNGRICVIDSPAGTDRKSVIKGIAASLIIEKARFLAEIEKPDTIFEPANRAGVEYFLVPEELKRTELVILSENDTKAMNLSSEMSNPRGEKNRTGLFDARDEKYGTVNDIYYTRAARNIFDNKETWGLPVFYIGSPGRLAPATAALYDNINELQSNFHTKKLLEFFEFIGIRELCEAMFRKFAAEHEWADIRAEFISLYDELSAERDEAGINYASICEIPELTPEDVRAELEEIDEKIEEYESSFSDLSDKVEEKEKRLLDLEEEADDAFDNLSVREQRLHRIMKSSKVSRYNYLQTQVENTSRELERLKDELLKVTDAKEHLYIQYDSLREKLVVAEEWAAQHKKRFNSIKSAYKKCNIADFNDLKKLYKSLYEEDIEEEDTAASIQTPETEKKEVLKEANQAGEQSDADSKAAVKEEVPAYEPGSLLDGPLMFSDEYLSRSEKLLFKALQLMKVFVRSSDKAKRNINLLLTIINEGKLTRMPSIVFDNAFASFQLLIPVVSMPIHILPLFSAAAGNNSVGNILISDAGSWSIDSAFPAFLKAQNLVMMGDRYSEMPKLALPYLAEDLLHASSDISDTFKHRNMSIYDIMFAQVDPSSARLAAVHSRDDSVFRMLKYTYGDRIFRGRPRTNSNFAITDSCFMDVNGKTSDKKTLYVEEQGKVVISLLNNIISMYGMAFFDTPNRSIYITSPFKSVVDGLRNLINTKLMAVLPAVAELMKAGKLKSLDISNFLYSFKNDNIVTLDEFYDAGNTRELMIVLGCDRHSYGSQATGDDLRRINSVISSVSGRVAFIGNASIWNGTRLLDMTTRGLEVIKVH